MARQPTSTSCGRFRPVWRRAGAEVLAKMSTGALTPTVQANDRHNHPYYNPDKITEDLHTACTSFAIAAHGVLSALCIMHEDVGPTCRTIDLDDHTGNGWTTDKRK